MVPKGHNDCQSLLTSQLDVDDSFEHKIVAGTSREIELVRIIDVDNRVPIYLKNRNI